MKTFEEILNSKFNKPSEQWQINNVIDAHEEFLKEYRFNELQELTIKHLQHKLKFVNPNTPYLTRNGKDYSRKEIIKEIQEKTEFGKYMVDSMYLLACSMIE